MEIRTENATVDDKSDEEYRDMWEDAKTGRSMRGASTFIASQVSDPVSHATWDKYDKDPSALTRRMKNHLRKVSGLPLLPPTIEEAMHDVVPDAKVAVLKGTAGDLDQVVLGNRDDPRWRRLAAIHTAPVRKRAPRHRPVASVEQDERRQRLGVDWKSVIEAGLETLARQKQGSGTLAAPDQNE